MLISSLKQVGRFTPKEMCLSTAKNSLSYRCLQNYLPIFFENNVKRHVCSSACHAANTKQFDDDPDFNIDFENELNWLKDRIAMSTQSKPQTDHPNLNENSDEHWLCKDHVEHDETTGTQNASEYESKFLSYPHSNWGPIPTGKHLFVPRLTADVAVELLTCELSELLKVERPTAYKIACCVRRSYGERGRRRQRIYPAITADDLQSTRAIVSNAVATAHALLREGIGSTDLHSTPELIRVPALSVGPRLKLVQQPRLFPSLREGAPLLLASEASLEQALQQCDKDAPFVPCHTNRLSFLAHVLKMDVATVCGSAANVGLTRIFSHDLVRLARNVDAFNYYRIPRPDIKVHFDALLYPIDKIESRLAAIAIAQNSPEVLSALRASASLANSSCDQLHRTLREQARTATSDPAHTLASLLQDSTREENISISTECSDSSPPLVSATVAASGAENNVDDADRVKNELDASGEDSHVLDLLKNYVPPVLYLTISSQFVFERYLYSKRKPRRWR